MIDVRLYYRAKFVKQVVWKHIPRVGDLINFEILEVEPMYHPTVAHVVWNQFKDSNTQYVEVHCRVTTDKD